MVPVAFDLLKSLFPKNNNHPVKAKKIPSIIIKLLTCARTLVDTTIDPTTSNARLGEAGVCDKYEPNTIMTVVEIVASCLVYCYNQLLFKHEESEMKESVQKSNFKTLK